VIVVFGSQGSLYVFISEMCYLYIYVFKYFSDIYGLLPNIGNCSPFLGVFIFVSFLSGFVCVRNFPWLDWERIII